MKEGLSIMPGSLSKHDRLFVNPEVISREEENGAYLFDPDTGKLKHINASGLAAYELCDGERTVGDIIAVMQQNYPNESKEKIEEDLGIFLSDLTELAFLKKHMNDIGEA
jgi:hypothetical protein